MHLETRRSTVRIAPARSSSQKKSAPGETIGRIIDDWRASRARTTSARDKYATEKLRQTAGNLKPKELRQAHIGQIVEYWRKNLSTSTCWWYCYALTQFLKFFKARTGRTELTVPRVRNPGPRTVIATPEELGKLTAAAQPWMRVLLQLCVSLALRLSEALDVKEANYRNGTISFRAKGGEMQSMPVTPDVEAAFRNAPPGDPQTTIVARYYGRPVSAAVAHHGWHDLKKKTGVNPNLNIHDLRRTTAVTAYDLTKDLRAVEQILRHRNLATTTRYLEHRDTGKLRTVLEALWQNTPTEAKQ